ncbi:MAG: hypothetical protein IPO04_17595 [Cytophagaceae bacterium]|nr:hypothetical protein [Cytophagaceae bacterium]
MLSKRSGGRVNSFVGKQKAYFPLSKDFHGKFVVIGPNADNIYNQLGDSYGSVRKAIL